MRSVREDRAAPKKHQRGIATASPTSIPCTTPRRARDVPHDETYGDQGCVHHPIEDPHNSLPPPYCDDGIRARL